LVGCFKVLKTIILIIIVIIIITQWNPALLHYAGSKQESQNQGNPSVPNIGQGEARRLKYNRLNLAAVKAMAIYVTKLLL
jgi:hypothetical protein